MRLSVHAHECNVWVRVWLPGSNEPLWFRREIGHKADAHAVAAAVEHAFSERVQSIRETAYYRGRESMRSRGKRLTHFSSAFCADAVGY